jgi:hypothetical protein
MNSEIPPRITIAPIAITIVLLPLKLLSPAVVVVGLTIGGAVVVLGIWAGDCGMPGLSGLLGLIVGAAVVAAGAVAEPFAAAAAGSASSAEIMPTATIRIIYRSEPSGCSMAWVSGASR